MSHSSGKLQTAIVINIELKMTEADEKSGSYVNEIPALPSSNKKSPAEE